MNRIIICLLVLLSGCASMENGSTQRVSIETENNNFFKSTICTLTNEEGKWQTKPMEWIEINRDGNPLSVFCENLEQKALVSFDPDFDQTFLIVNLVLVDACIISCIIDGLNNAFYAYPAVMTIDMENN